MRKFLLAAILFMLVNPPSAWALSCAAIPEIEEAYEKYDAILIADVEEVIRKKENNQIKLKVIKSFKGMDEASILVKENMTWGALNGPSEVGEQYLFFLRQKEGVWENPLCSPTMKAADASEQLAYLQSKEILLKNTPMPTESPSPTASYSEHKALDESPAEANTRTFPNLTIEILILGCLVGVMGYGIIRYAKRRN